jgi:hypothetical protein
MRSPCPELLLQMFFVPRVWHCEVSVSSLLFGSKIYKMTIRSAKLPEVPFNLEYLCIRVRYITIVPDFGYFKEVLAFKPEDIELFINTEKKSCFRGI